MDSHLLVLLFTAVIVSTVAAKNPWFCLSYDCPSYTSENRGGYEVRNYATSSWVAMSASGSNWDSNRYTRGMFGKLYSYIRGANSAGQKIDMTVPVLTKIEAEGNGYKFTMMFYLAVPNPPAPTDPDVFLVTRPAGPVYVKSFPSFFWRSEYEYWAKMNELRQDIGDSASYIDGAFYKASYNSPYHFFYYKQHEVWMDSA